MKNVTLKTLVESFNNATSGSFVGITDYQSENGDVVSVVGQLGCGYEKVKQFKIEGLRKALENEDFEPITVKGQGYAKKLEDGTWEFGRKSKERTLINFCEDYTKAQVMSVARDILFGWENPVERASNKVQLTDKEDGLSLNLETNNFNFTLLVQQETYKEDLSDKAKAGKEVKITATQPLSVLKETIRNRFEKKLKSYTISEGKFASLTLAGNKFLSEEINF